MPIVSSPVFPANGSAPQGTVVKDSLEVAAKMINDSGGALGRAFELVIGDDQEIPEKARAATEKLITRDKVFAIGGEHQSSAVLAGIEVAHRNHVLYINTNGFADIIREKGYVEVFSPAGYNSLLAIPIADAVRALGAKRATAFCENTDFGVGIGKAIGDLVKERARRRIQNRDAGSRRQGLSAGTPAVEVESAGGGDRLNAAARVLHSDQSGL